LYLHMLLLLKILVLKINCHPDLSDVVINMLNDIR